MSSNDSSLMAGIIYYSQEKYFRHVQQAAAVGLEKFSNDPVLQFFKAYGVLREERIQDAISSLESIQNHPDVSLCSVMALIYAHKCCETIDREAIQELESSLKEIRKTASGTALYYAGLFLWLMGRHDKAKEYIDRTLKVSSSSREGYVLRGWVDLSSDKPHTVKKSIKYLEHGIQDTKDVLGLMGKATYFMMLQNYSGALEVVNQITVAWGSFLPALVLKMRLFLARQDWERTVETGHRILEKDESNIDACQILAVHELAREGNITTAAKHVRNLIKALETREPQNPSLHLKKILVVGRLSGRHQAILRLVCSFLERTFMATSSYAHVATELGYLFILQDQVKEASLWYSEAMKLDESSMAALTGVIWCQILDGHLEEAEHQLEFLKEVQQSLGKSEVLVFLQALLASKKHKGEQEAAALLKEAAELHFSSMQALPLSSEYLERLDPLFLVCIAKEYLVFCPKQPRSPGQIVSPLLKQVSVILNPVVKAAPALIDPLYVMAQVKYLSGELENAQSTLQRCLELDPTSVDAYLLMSQIYLAQGNFAMCSHCLELGVSYNFQVRDHPLYHFIKARALNKSGDYPEAIKALKMIIKLPILKMEESKKFHGPSVRPSERVSILLELADALRMNGELHEATKVMQDTINEFSGTPEEIRITIANVDLALSKGNVDLALSILRNITPKQPCYTEAKEKMASIYLQTRKDVHLYIGCYRELCEHLPGPHTSLLLGDAFMNIQEVSEGLMTSPSGPLPPKTYFSSEREERDCGPFPHQPEKALEVYDEAYRKNPHDASLISRIGQAYVKTHQYTKAINYYEAAQKISGQDFLCCDLAELLLKLKKFNKAEKVLKQALDHDFVKDIPSMMNDVKCLLLLAKVYKSHKKEDVMDTLNKAMDLQSRILKRVPLEQPEMIPSQKQLAASICIHFGEYYLAEKEYAKAVQSYKDALSYSPIDNKVVLELARLYLLQGHLDLCEQHCAILLQTEKNHETASVMMADLMFRKQKYEAAINLYHQVLEEAPDNFPVLNKLIDLLRRSGKLEDAPAFFELAKKVSSRVPLEPGFNYCRGIYCWHVGQPNEALKFLNKARKDSTWGQSATYYMVQICLNPDNEIVGGEAFENLVTESKKELEQHGVRTAEKLLREFYPHSAWGQTQLRLLQSLCLLATREKANMEAALGTFIEMAQAEKDSIPALLAVAQAYSLLKQVPKARTQLKRLAKAPWTLAEAEDLEKSWLLLADIYCQGGKFDLASELLRRCMQYNKSCCKAYEYMGFIMEREQSYKDAATNYELAWKYSHHANPASGFKLAFNYLKDKRFVEAIEVCHDVLKEHPNYPRIREEILEKAQGSLRP
ncbi:tetratricopeptide repeat protein 21A isoform X1 [Balaenoptera musculus]|uniref:Tetratricopeptide repeat protein 21A isoform X1 n=1 Tax=Balaenoptera musculus TaxID=9771 RepID=A0A8B8YVE5_BALMU|nr:tetratricopeptide repeat protein 21A isoform X1 [Balaenoptera musculus]XP_036723679.1 tetratricopeptide repeat protein 21A isoform X1 [Balaenoptera musculus]XP_036723680.1 tetratricopeptide repeat protein 21A isoform X1 [Balaenoptera musculus]XP_036723681.1 tetratricopeptide repeat protein 21A isoform X1 [Balaenoptera musculus]XP_036723682.1 tetratricopeptide repeat protein 21A isoform X1 [Balaenoptera musculus]